MALEVGNFIDDLVDTNPVSATDLVRYGADHIRLIKEVLQNTFAGSTGAIVAAGLDVGTVNAIVITPVTPLLEYTTRMMIVWLQGVTNTGATTINVSGLGAKAVVSVANAALASGDLVAGRVYVGIYDGTSVQLAAVTKNYVDQQAFSAALPAQSLGLLISDGTTASFSKTTTGFPINTVKGSDVASASTINLDTATGNLVHITGTTTITAITLASGAERTLVFDGILTLTHNATTLILPGGQNIVTAAGDRAIVIGDGSGNVRVIDYVKANGRPVIGATVIRDARTSNTILGVLDQEKLIDITSGTFTQTFAASTTLGSGWFCYIRNSGTGVISLDPNSSELIDGIPTFNLYQGETRLVQSDGANLYSVLLVAGSRNITSSESFIVPPGINWIDIDLFGGGGGGGSGCRGPSGSDRQGGSGGGGGARAKKRIIAPAAGTSISVTIGSGGTGGTGITVNSTSGNNGTAGGNTSFGSYLTAYGGGYGAGGAETVSTDSTGGGGGGIASAGDNGSNAGGEADGGAPGGNNSLANSTLGRGNVANGANNIGFGGGAGARPGTQNNGGCAEYGGGGGGGGDGSTSNGGSSIFGASGGGGGGDITSANAQIDGGAGGNSGTYTAGGGGTGGAQGTGAGPGGNGSNNTDEGGDGGGGGGSAQNTGSPTGTTAGAGGNGGTPGGGGGGGGASMNGTGGTSGAGGNGGRGEARITWG